LIDWEIIDLIFDALSSHFDSVDVERAKGSPPSPGQHMNSVMHAEEMMSLLRRSHASLWSALESILEELILKFRPLPEEELLSPIIALLERAEVQLGSNVKQEDEEESVAASIWKTVSRIASKFFRPSESSNRQDERARKTALFKDTYRDAFESDFHVSSSDTSSNLPAAEGKTPMTLEEFVIKLRSWKLKLEQQISSKPISVSLIKSSHTLAAFSVADAPDLWPGSCNTRASSRLNDRELLIGSEAGGTQPTTTSSAAAKKAALAAATAAAAAATREGVGGDYGGGSSSIEIPGQYVPNSSLWADGRPNPELHPKLMRFEQSVQTLRRGDQLVRRLGMVGSDGKIYYFLVQAAVPYWTRTDERTMQTLYILDKLLRKGICSSQLQLSVQPHSVVPLAQRLRLVHEPDSRTSLEDVYRDVCDKSGKDITDMCTHFSTQITEATVGKRPEDDEIEDHLIKERAARLKAYEHMKEANMANSFILLKHLLSFAGGPEPLFHMRQTFARQWASNCLLQFAFCVAERTPPRVVLLASTGGVLSPEFRIVYSRYVQSNQLVFKCHLKLLIFHCFRFPTLKAKDTWNLHFCHFV